MNRFAFTTFRSFPFVRCGCFFSFFFAFSCKSFDFTSFRESRNSRVMSYDTAYSCTIRRVSSMCASRVSLSFSPSSKGESFIRASWYDQRLLPRRVAANDANMSRVTNLCLERQRETREMAWLQMCVISLSLFVSSMSPD
jgi:hypothetical protein